MQILHRISEQAWNNTWEKVIGQPISTIMIAAFIFLIVFILARVYRGKEYASDWLFDTIAGIVAIIIVATGTFLVEMLIIVPLNMIGYDETQIGTLTNSVTSLEIATNDLSAQKDSIQKNLDKDEASIKAIAAIAGMTNGNLVENLGTVPVTLNEIQQDIKSTKDRMFAPIKCETFHLSDSNRVFVFFSTNYGPQLFFKLKHIPIEDSIQIIAQGVGSQAPLMMKGAERNVVWVQFSDLGGLKDINFVFTYKLDVENTNLIRAISTNYGAMFFDNVHQEFENPTDE